MAEKRRMSQQEKDTLLGKLQKKRRELENLPEIIAWKLFLTLSYSEQENIRKQWAEYYEKVHTTKAYKRFVKQKEAMKRGDIILVKAYAEKAREQRLNEDWELVKPQFTDPFVFDFGLEVKAYRDNERMIDELVDREDMSTIAVFEEDKEFS